jgi:hypothetical protein
VGRWCSEKEEGKKKEKRKKEMADKWALWCGRCTFTVLF